MNRYTIVFNENGMPSIGRIIGIYYYFEREFSYLHENQKIKLVSLVYLKRTKEIAEIKHVNLPKRLLKRYDGQIASEKLLKELEEIGIHHMEDISKFVEKFNDYFEMKDYEKYKNSNKKDYNEEMYQKMIKIDNLLNSPSLIEEEKKLFLTINNTKK